MVLEFILYCYCQSATFYSPIVSIHVSHLLVHLKGFYVLILLTDLKNSTSLSVCTQVMNIFDKWWHFLNLSGSALPGRRCGPTDPSVANFAPTTINPDIAKAGRKGGIFLSQLFKYSNIIKAGRVAFFLQRGYLLLPGM